MPTVAGAGSPASLRIPNVAILRPSRFTAPSRSVRARAVTCWTPVLLRNEGNTLVPRGRYVALPLPHLRLPLSTAFPEQADPMSIQCSASIFYLNARMWRCRPDRGLSTLA